MSIFSVLSILFSFALLYSAFMVIFSRNPVHSILFLILVFCNTTPLFILLGAEFLAFLLVVVYVGAIAVLFLFVVMMLDIKIFEDSRTSSLVLYYPVIFSVLFLFCFFIIRYFYIPVLGKYGSIFSFISSSLFRSDNLFLFSNLLYSFFSPHFLFSSLILLVAMVGAIVLTFVHNTHHQTLKQQYYKQVASSPLDITYVQRHRSFL